MIKKPEPSGNIEPPLSKPGGKFLSKSIGPKIDIEYQININQPLTKFNFTNLREPSLQKNAERSTKKSIFDKLAYTINLFYIILRLCFQIVIVCLPHSPPIQLALVLVIEALYFSLYTYIFSSFKHYDTIVSPIKKIAQSLCLTVVTIHMVLINSRLRDGKDVRKLQDRTLRIIMAGIYIDFILLVVVVIVKTFRNKKKAKGKKSNRVAQGDF